MKVVEETQTVRVMQGPWSIESAIKDVLASGTQEEAFNLMDLGEVVARYQQWKELMPRVEPFYAVKCNDDQLLVSTLAALGSSFDCASKGEIELVTSLGVAPERIIYANPVKMVSHINHASAVGIHMMTFDSEVELIKIKQHMPHAQLVIRIRCDAAVAQCPLGIKFGCDPLTDAPRLIKLAAVLGLEIIGVSFHCGSGADEPAVYARGIAHCRALFHIGTEVGHHMQLVDLGGGFPGNKHTSIVEVAGVIKSALEEHFPERKVRVIAEPGRYFAAAAYTLAAMVFGMRDVPSEQRPGGTHTMYYMNDGVFGSFNDVMSYHAIMNPVPLNPSGLPPHECSVWGPSCDGVDCVVARTTLPPLSLGDWLVFYNLGAYSLPLASRFNGFPIPTVKTVIDIKYWSMLRELTVSPVNFTVDFELHNETISDLSSEASNDCSKASDVCSEPYTDLYCKSGSKLVSQVNDLPETEPSSETDSYCNDCIEADSDGGEAEHYCSKADNVHSEAGNEHILFKVRTCT